MLTEPEIKRLRQSNYIASTAIHPDTKKIIPFYMRLSGFTIFNMPTIFAVLFIQNQTPFFSGFIQWVNQTYNAGMNYGNRNASSKFSVKDLGIGYCGAVTVSVGIAIWSRVLFAPLLTSLSGSKLVLINAFIGWIAGATAGACNLTLMRFKEL